MPTTVASHQTARAWVMIAARLLARSERFGQKLHCLNDDEMLFVELQRWDMSIFEVLSEVLSKELRSNKALTEAEVRLYGRLTETMVKQIEDFIEHKPGTVMRYQKDIPLPPAYFDDVFESTKEAYSSSLSRLGVLQPFTDELHECIYILKIPAELTYRHAVSCHINGPSLYELLTAFVYFSTWYGGGFRTAKEGTFPVCADFDDLFQDLVAACFAERCGREYEWTEKIAPVMKAAMEWELDDQ